MSVLFLSECFTETLLYSYLLLEQKNYYTHQRSIYKVLSTMMKDEGKFEVLIGCIDSDKHITYPYFREFQEVTSQFNISILKNRSNQNRILIQLGPAAEA